MESFYTNHSSLTPHLNQITSYSAQLQEIAKVQCTPPPPDEIFVIDTRRKPAQATQTPQLPTSTASSCGGNCACSDGKDDSDACCNKQQQPITATTSTCGGNCACSGQRENEGCKSGENSTCDEDNCCKSSNSATTTSTTAPTATTISNNNNNSTNNTIASMITAQYEDPAYNTHKQKCTEMLQQTGLSL